MDYKEITQVDRYKGWNMYRQTFTYVNGWGKICTGKTFFSVKGSNYFVGGLKDVKSFIDAGVQANQVDERINTILNPQSFLYEQGK